MKDILSIADDYKALILEAERYIWNNPETGYKELRTSAYMAEAFERLGYSLTYAEGITGFYTTVDTGREGPEVLILGELDSIICPNHKDADSVTGAVHSCGHNAQCAALLGIAATLTHKEVLGKLCGKIRLCAVPAEELLEIEYRKELIKEGKIKYMCGKTEFLSRGYFDGVDMAFMVHTSTEFSTMAGSVGCIAKNVTYKGVSSHAGGSPWSGVNALYAANCGINAINAIRETFKERDVIRVHPIITHGGNTVNAIPDTVTIESYVRGNSFEAIADANRRVNRAICGGAVSIGANVDINDIPGYAPHKNDVNLSNVAKEAAEIALEDNKLYQWDGISPGSTDMGDLSSVMPVVHPYCGGAEGTTHGADYGISDPYKACVLSAKWQLAMLVLLLGDGAKRAKKVIEESNPPFASKEAYLSYLSTLSCKGDRIRYTDNGAEIEL